MSDALKLNLENQVSEFQTLVPAVTDFLERHEISSEAQFVVNLAVEELVLNVIDHAFDDSEPHQIDFELSVDDHEIVLQLLDDGRPFDPTQAPEPDFEQPVEERRVGGLGIHLVHELTAGLTYERAAGKNRLEVRISRAA